MPSPSPEDVLYPPLQAALRAGDVEAIWRLCDQHTRSLWCALAHVNDYLYEPRAEALDAEFDDVCACKVADLERGRTNSSALVTQSFGELEALYAKCHAEAPTITRLDWPDLTETARIKLTASLGVIRSFLRGFKATFEEIER